MRAGEAAYQLHPSPGCHQHLDFEMLLLEAFVSCILCFWPVQVTPLGSLKTVLSREEGEAELSLPALCACNCAIKWIKK